MSTGGWSKVRLARMHDILAGHVARGDMPGLVALVSRRDDVHVAVIGTQAEGGPPMRRDTIFRIASLTKPITAAAAMILVEECRVRLDDPVDRFVPELANPRVLKRLDGPVEDTVPARRSITLRDLLTFRLGAGVLMSPPDSTPIQRAMTQQGISQGPPHPSTGVTPDEWIRRFATLPLMYQPGERWMYNTGSDVLSVLIARVARQSFETFLQERIFEPLGMDDTGFSVPGSEIDRLATSYDVSFETGKLRVYDNAEGGEWSRPPAFPSGSGGLVSTIDDYLAFGRMLLNHGKHGHERILSRPSVLAMTTDQLTPEQKTLSGLYPGQFENNGWGFGVSVVTRRDDLPGSVGRFGWDGGLGTSWASDPAEGLVGILMTQRAWTSPVPPPVCRDFWTSAYQAIDD